MVYLLAGAMFVVGCIILTSDGCVTAPQTRAERRQHNVGIATFLIMIAAILAAIKFYFGVL